MIARHGSKHRIGSARSQGRCGPSPITKCYNDEIIRDRSRHGSATIGGQTGGCEAYYLSSILP